MLRNLNIQPLLPHFSENEKQEVRQYYDFSKKYEAELQQASMHEFEAHPVLGPLIKSMPKEAQEANNRESDRLLREAVFEDKWEPYIRHLMMQGIQFAHMGLDFKTWYEIVGIVRKYYRPIIWRLLDTDRDYILEVSNGMNLLFDYAMCVIGESFIYERNRTIESQNKRQEGMIKELESFAYIISHDLKTPLRGIASLTDWIAQDYHEKLDETGKEYLTLLKSRVVRLEGLIDGVLAYSRAGRLDMQKEKVDLEALLKEVIEMQEPKESVKIEIDTKLPTVEAVKSAMMQVFSNLIGNAIKHNDKEQVMIHVGATEKSDEWTFYVKDNGPGIEREFYEKVFKIFQTLKTKDEMDSTGIGLSVVKKIIENAGGKVWIESEKGKGAIFFFTVKK